MATTALDTQARSRSSRARATCGLRRLAEGLGPDQTYERARALSLALAVEGQLDSALAELGLGSAAALNGATRTPSTAQSTCSPGTPPARSPCSRRGPRRPARTR